jgi:hypothetical protein
MKKDRQLTEAARFEDSRSFVFKDGREQLAGYDWNQRKKELRDRSKGRCEMHVKAGSQESGITIARCQAAADDPHHIIPRSKGRDDRLSNLMALCRYHHNLLDERKVRSDRKERQCTTKKTK